MKRKTNRKQPGGGGKQPFHLRHILVPIDFSGISRQALDVAVPLAKKFAAKISLLHVVPPNTYPPAFGLLLDATSVAEKAERELAAVARRHIPATLRNVTLVSTGQPAREITDAVRRLKVDLLVLTTHGHTSLAHVVLGSTAEQVVRYAPCPVLTVRRR